MFAKHFTLMLVVALLATIFTTSLAFADDPGVVGVDPIISLVPVSNCQNLGLPATASAVVNGVYCTSSGTVNQKPTSAATGAISLTGILNGSIGLLIGDSTTPAWDVINDTGSTVTDLKLYYSGSLASNAFLDLQINGGFSALNSCKVTQNNGTVTSGCSNNTNFPVSLPALVEFYASGAAPGIANGAVFEIDTASFAAAGQDTGCISGTSNCKPVSTPEPNSLLLLGAGLSGLGLWLRRKRASISF